MEQICGLWDTSLDALSSSYAKTLVQMESGTATNAYSEYRTGFRLTVKKLYVEAATVYPPQFSKVGDWCSWMKELYVLAGRVETNLVSMPAKDSATWKAAADNLEALRGHFYTLHQKTERLAANDYIYAFRQEANKTEPAAAPMKQSMNSLTNAPLSRVAKSNEAAYRKACADWASAVEPILKDDVIGADELAALREATEPFYRSFGMQFE